MTVIKMVDRELTENETQTIEKGKYYTDCKTPFACIGDGVIVLLENSDGADTEKLKAETVRLIRETLSSPPDYSAYLMDDGHGVVIMTTGVSAISPKKLGKDKIKDGYISRGAGIFLRGKCLSACERGNIIALVCKPETETE